MGERLSREMVSPSLGRDRQRRAREGPELACVKILMVHGCHTQGEKDELTSFRGTVFSAWQNLQWDAKDGEPGLRTRVSNRHVVLWAKVTGKAGEKRSKFSWDGR